MNTYEIEVRAVGYETTFTEVLAASRLDAIKKKHQAVTEWLKHNDCPESARGLAFVYIRKK
jgi:hypothetical protein